MAAEAVATATTTADETEETATASATAILRTTRTVGGRRILRVPNPAPTICLCRHRLVFRDQ